MDPKNPPQTYYLDKNLSEFLEKHERKTDRMRFFPCGISLQKDKKKIYYVCYVLLSTYLNTLCNMLL